MAGTTPVSTLRELPYQFHSDIDEDTAPSGQTYKTDDLHFINNNTSILQDLVDALYHPKNQKTLGRPKDKYSLHIYIQHKTTDNQKEKHNYRR